VSEVLDFCRRFVAFVEREGVASDEELAEFQWITLRLCASAACPTDGASAPVESENSIANEPRTRAEIGARFPRFGWYWSVLDRFAAAESGVGAGDAIDDIEDLYNDAREALEELDSNGEAEAEDHFRLLFRIHAGAHAHALATYLHDVRTRIED
jgi:hypothetical protein